VRREVVGARVRQGAAVAPYGRAECVDHVGLAHAPNCSGRRSTPGFGHQESNV
jgi:hypothetical protein